MAVETASDLAAFISTNDFGVSASYTVAGGSAATISGIFDNNIIEVEAGGGVPIAVRQPRFLCRTADVASAADGDAITINSTAYTIRMVDEDGTGMTQLILEKN